MGGGVRGPGAGGRGAGCVRGGHGEGLECIYGSASLLHLYY